MILMMIYCPSPPWCHYCDELIPEEGEGCWASALVLPGGRYITDKDGKYSDSDFLLSLRTRLGT